MLCSDQSILLITTPQPITDTYVLNYRSTKSHKRTTNFARKNQKHCWLITYFNLEIIILKEFMNTNTSNHSYLMRQSLSWFNKLPEVQIGFGKRWAIGGRRKIQHVNFDLLSSSTPTVDRLMYVVCNSPISRYIHLFDVIDVAYTFSQKRQNFC